MTQHTALTAKYRPQTFADVAGQDTLKAILSRASLESKVASAYLFSGTRGVGKTTIARVFAKALNCRTAPTAEPCNQCDICRAVTAGNAVDVVEIDGASNRGIDDVRKLKEVVGYAPMDGRYKIFIIDEAHMLSREAFNALLKTLEEPPARVTFIMATTEAHKFPATIISRCQHYVFKRLPEPELVTHLEKVLTCENVEFAPSAVRLIARRGAGSVRDSMSLLGQVLALGGGSLTEDSARNVLGLAGHEAFLTMLESIGKGDCLQLTVLLRNLLDQGLDIGFFLRELVNVWRNLFMLRQSGAAALEVVELPLDEAKILYARSQDFSLSHIHACWQMTLEAQRRILTSLEPALALELLLLNLAMMPQLLSMEGLSALGRKLPPPSNTGGGAGTTSGGNMPSAGGSTPAAGNSLSSAEITDSVANENTFSVPSNASLARASMPLGAGAENLEKTRPVPTPMQQEAPPWDEPETMTSLAADVPPSVAPSASDVVASMVPPFSESPSMAPSAKVLIAKNAPVSTDVSSVKIVPTSELPVKVAVVEPAFLQEVSLEGAPVDMHSAQVTSIVAESIEMVQAQADLIDAASAREESTPVREEPVFTQEEANPEQASMIPRELEPADYPPELPLDEDSAWGSNLEQYADVEPVRAAKVTLGAAAADADRVMATMESGFGDADEEYDEGDDSSALEESPLKLRAAFRIASALEFSHSAAQLRPEWDLVIDYAVNNQCPAWFTSLIRSITAEWKEDKLVILPSDAFIYQQILERESYDILLDLLTVACKGVPSLDIQVPQVVKRDREALKQEIYDNPYVQMVEKGLGAKIFDYGQMR